MTAGRPTDFTQEKADEICVRLAEGESLRTICSDEYMPARSTVFMWLLKHQEFADQYTRARELQADTMVDEIPDIADDGSNDWMERLDDEGRKIGWQVNGENIQRSRVRIDARKWVAGKLRPKKYGERVDHTLAGDPENPIKSTVEIVIVDPKDSK